MRAARIALEAILLVVGVAACNSDSGTNPIPGPGIPETFHLINLDPAWSPDGTRIVYTHMAQTSDEWRRGADQLWLYSLPSGSRQYLAPGNRPDWSPDGGRIVYSGGSILWILDLATRRVTRLTSFEEAFNPRWSPDGRTILFLRWSHPDRQWAISPDGTGLRDLGILSYYVDWHPDAKHLALTTSNERQVQTLDLDDLTSPPRVIVDVAPDYCHYPRWSPDGGHIAYERSGPSAGIWLIAADGQDDHLLVADGNQMSWSPDGRRLVYEHLDAGSNTVDLWVFSMETGDATPLFPSDVDRFASKEEWP